MVTVNKRATPEAPLILLTGASGYIGGRLLKLLEHEGHRLRCLARRPDTLRPKIASSTEVVCGDVLDRASLDSALQSVNVAYYLVHSMGSSGSFEEADREAALNFGHAASRAGVERIIYLGGLGSDDAALSPHLRSRQEVGRLLRESGVPVLEFRASIVIGAGSLSFEMIRSLVERLPLMITPKWVNVPAQPIAIEDLLEYLVSALQLPVSRYGVYEIGGADKVSYGDIMRVYARQRGLRRRMIPVPFLTPFLSSLWLGLVTPLYARIGRKLIESIVHPTVVVDQSALTVFAVRPVGIETAVRRAFASEENEFATTRWSDALSSSGGLPVFLQQLLQMTAWQTGKIILPGAIASAVTMAVVGRNAMRLDARYTVIAGAFLFFWSMLKMSHLTSASGSGDLFWPLILRGAGLGLIFVPLTNATMADLKVKDLAQGTGMFNLMRQLGGSLGIAVMATLLARFISVEKSVLVEHVGANDPETLSRLSLIARGLVSRGINPMIAQQQALAILDRQVTVQSSMLAFSRIYLYSGLVLLCGLPLLLLFRTGRARGSMGPVH